MSLRGDREYSVLNRDSINKRRRERYLMDHPFHKHNTYSRANKGYRDDLFYCKCKQFLCSCSDNYFRSSWEANVARYLNLLVEREEIQHWEYEPIRFTFNDMVIDGKKIKGVSCGVMSYLPDFLIVNNDDSISFIEVKGWMDGKSKTKIRRLKKYYPEIRLDIIGQKEYDEIRKTEARNIDSWEYRR